MKDNHKLFIQSVLGFIELLRRAGLKIGTDLSVKATQSLLSVPINHHQDLYWALYACLISDHDQEEVFNQVFVLYWGNSKLPDSALAVSLPRSKIKSSGEKSFSRRTLEAFNSFNHKPAKQKTEIEKLHLSWSDHERLEHVDFDSMSSEDYLKAQKLVAKLKVIFKPALSRRFNKTQQVMKIDFRNTFKQSNKYAGQLIELKYKKSRPYYPSLVILIDVSGSMSRYAQIMLRFAYLLNKSRNNIHVFLFATKLTSISSDLCKSDIDKSLEIIGNKVDDWNSGTRIGQCIKEFNYKYSRRIINSKTEILFVSDGLDRGDQIELDKQVTKLKRSCKKLIWLNPLLRYEQYQPRAKGASTILPHVDKMLPVHNLASLEQLIEFLYSNSRQSKIKVA